MSPFIAIIRRDVLLVARRKSEVLTTLFFFVIVTSLFPLSLGTDPILLRQIAPGIIWVAALLATFLSLPRLFESDYADGTLEQLLLSPTPLPLLVFGKILVHWLTAGLPLLLLTPIIGIQYHLEVASLQVLMEVLLLGTPILSLIGAMGAALTLGVRGQHVLLSLLILPFYIPVLIFGTSTIYAQQAGMDTEAHFSLMLALLLLSLFFIPLVVVLALKIALENA